MDVEKFSLKILIFAIGLGRGVRTREMTVSTSFVLDCTFQLVERFAVYVSSKCCPTSPENFFHFKD